MVDNNLGLDRLAGPKALPRSQSLQTNNPLIAPPLSGSPNCTLSGTELHLFGAKASPPTHTILLAPLNVIFKFHI